jgi:hypothetical protein
MRPGIEHQLDVSEHLLDLPEFLVLADDPGGLENSICSFSGAA